ncbi:hypothetical protein J7E81_05410 [Bacillus sp. ISL-18]|uniref:hypothetical protein n=1 Tax=Bacillus sp. ISL-18 TaxID=2819118 RepID=UPI001BEA3F9C|nr:hypothetical protein [Bacillus sp. ISL-18]MBT2654685.1 hypothetical protein [Bacillus sp. ISL-18]
MLVFMYLLLNADCFLGQLESGSLPEERKKSPSRSMREQFIARKKVVEPFWVNERAVHCPKKGSRAILG